MSDSVHNISQTQQEQLAEAAGKRAAKIAAYRQKAEAKEKTALLKPRVLSGSVDDEIQVSLLTIILRNLTHHLIFSSLSVSEITCTFALIFCFRDSC